MANVTVSSGTGSSIDKANRCVVRTAGDRVYVFLVDGPTLAVRAYKGNQNGEPTSFANQDSVTGTGIQSAGVAAAIDSADIVHCIYYQIGPAMADIKALRYVRFDTTTDTFGTPEDASSSFDNDGSFILRMGMCVDENDKPHIVWLDGLTNMGNDFDVNYYSNKTGANWRTRVQVSISTAVINPWVKDIMIADPLSSVNADRPIIVERENGQGANMNAYYGDALDATSFTKADDISGTVNAGEASMAIDSNEKIYVAHSGQSSNELRVTTHLNSAAWGTWANTLIDTSLNWGECSIAINGTDVYVYAESTADNDIRLYKDEGSGFSEETDDVDLPNVGTFNDVKGKWQTRQLNKLATYHFDAHTTIIDNDAWSFDADAFDGNDSTFAEEPSGIDQANSLEGHGTNAPASGTTFTRVRARAKYRQVTGPMQLKIYNDGQTETLLSRALPASVPDIFSSWSTLTEPTGGWTYAKLQELEVEFWAIGAVTNVQRMFIIEIETLEEIQSTKLDYVFESSDGTIQYNTIDVAAAAPAVVRRRRRVVRFLN